MVLSATLAGLLVLDLREAIQTLITDSDLDLLRRAPIAPAALFAIKLGDALPKTSLLFAVVALPAVAAFHWAFPLPWWTWLLTPLLMFALWAIPMGVRNGGSPSCCCASFPRVTCARRSGCCRVSPFCWCGSSTSSCCRA